MTVLEDYPWVADRFTNVTHTKGGTEVLATCPLGHTNAKVKLSIGRDGQLLVHCFRCGHGATLEILRAVGATYKDCYPAATDWKQVKRSVVARYAYRDEAGTLLYETVRLEPGYGGGAKTFCQRQPDGRGGWVWNLDGVRRVLYRLPELLAPENAGRAVLVVAGEKDVETLRGIGVLASTNVCGERAAWEDTYSQVLAPHDVVVVEDRDATGRRHANEVVGSLVAHDVASVRRATLPAKDATAFINGLRTRGVTDRDDLRRELGVALKATRKWEAVAV